tara:strand:+ start:313 stop:699 length:387 start_codon:yes stop_codon:yes gene_type:complete
MSLKPSGKRPTSNVFTAPKKLTNRERGDLHEEETAEKVGGRTQPNSGASPWISHKGDVSSDSFIYQCKTTDKKRYTLSEKVLGEVYRQAKLTSKEPAMVVRMEAIRDPIPKEWVCVPMSLWRDIIGEE